MLFIISWRLTLFVLLPIVATILFMRFIFPRVRSYFHHYFHRRSRLTALVSDSVSGVRVVKSFGQEQVELDKFDVASSSYRDSGIELVKRWSIFHPAMHLLIMCGSVIVWLVGGRLILRGPQAPGGMTLGDVVAYAGYLMMFYRPVFMLTRMSDMITNALAAGERVLDILDVEPDITDDPNAKPITSIKGKIELWDVHFGYDSHDEVIKGVSLTIKPNEMIGLVGKSGVGKSTIINLVSRLYDVNKGGILILDEATSSVDVQTEAKIQSALDHLTKGRTTIAIAHRLATLRNCDRIVVLDEGKVLESGSHAALMEKKGAFYALATSQEKLSAVVAVEG